MVLINKKLTKVNRRIGNNKENKYIVIHYVGGISTAKNNVDYFYENDLQKSAHYFVDENEIWQCVEDENIAFHCGTSKTDCTNENSIGVEMCCKKNGYWYFEPETVSKTVNLVRELMKKFDIKVDNVIRHFDVNLKNCPEPFVRDETAWLNFKTRLVDWKYDIFETALQNGIITDEAWGGKLNEPIPTWAVFAIANNLYKNFNK